MRERDLNTAMKDVHDYEASLVDGQACQSNVTSSLVDTISI